jgi:hypothetical protein
LPILLLVLISNSTNLQRRNNKIQKTKRIEEMLNVVFPYNCKKMFFMSRHVS